VAYQGIQVSLPHGTKAWFPPATARVLDLAADCSPPSQGVEMPSNHYTLKPVQVLCENLCCANPSRCQLQNAAFAFASLRNQADQAAAVECLGLQGLVACQYVD